MIVPLFIRKIVLRLRFSKWIYRIEYLETLVKVLQCIAPKLWVNAQTKIQEFCKEATRVIEAGEYTSKQILDKLESLLQEISNDSKLRRFLGRNEPTIGGGNGINEAWSSAKMHDFFHEIMLWETEKSCNFRFSFNEEESLRVLTANDIQLYGPTAGPLFRSRMHLIWLANGKISASFASLDSARTIALTPRLSRLTTSRSDTPLNFSSSSVMITPAQQEQKQEPIVSVRISELSRTPQEIPCFLQSSLLSKTFLQFLKDAHDLTGLGRKGNMWYLYDNLIFFLRVYGVNIYYNDILNGSFLDAISHSKLVKDALRICLNGEPEVDTLHSLTRGTNDNQSMFMDTLKMVVMHELWLIQNEGKVVSPFVYKSPQGVWKQDPVTSYFLLIPVSLAQIVEAA